ncbi:MAG: DEAD/DEAH box helicase [Erysipelotrichaceae bacterium]|nr:DEAD/DEAH box helicase [Erysipelotrichaceae bacterium]
MADKKLIVHVLDSNPTRICLAWPFSSAIRNFMAKDLVKNEDYFWEVVDNGGPYKSYKCWVNYNILPELLDVFVDNGYNIDKVDKALKSITIDEKPRYKTLETFMVSTGDEYLYLKWSYDRSLKAITDNIPKQLGRWVYDNNSRDPSNKYLYRVNKCMLYDLIPLFEREGYDVGKLQYAADNYTIDPPKEIEDVYSSWLVLLQEQSEERYRRENLSEILSAEDKDALEPGEYEMIDLSKRDLPFTPYDFQIEDIKTMLRHKRFLNSNEMGLGKTMEAVAVGESIPGKKLVVCPASLRFNWRKEIHNINKDAEIDILYSKDEYHAGKDWTIIGYPSLEKHLSSLITEGFKVVFFDEAHFIQATTRGHAASKRAKAALELGNAIEYVYPITGTPKTNRNKNLYNILQLLKHPIASKKGSYEEYANRYCGGCYAKGREDTKNSHDRELHERIAPWMIRHLRSEVLPDLTKQRIIIDAEVNLTEYEEAMKRYREVSKDPALTGRQRYAASLGELQRARVALAKEKIPTTIDLAKDFVNSEESVVIITCFRSVVKAIEDKFKSKCVKIIGGMNDAQKQESIDKFQSGECPILVMNVIAGGVGITLTKAHIAIVNDYEFTVGNMVQAEDRICRAGQKEHCLIYYVSAIGSMLDESFMAMLTEKSSSINAVIDGGRGETVDFVTMINEKLGITLPKAELSEEEIEKLMSEETEEPVKKTKGRNKKK